jgi:hypothetical protein
MSDKIRHRHAPTPKGQLSNRALMQGIAGAIVLAWFATLIL